MSGIDNILRGTKSGVSNVSIGHFTTVYQNIEGIKTEYNLRTCFVAQYHSESLRLIPESRSKRRGNHQF